MHNGTPINRMKRSRSHRDADDSFIQNVTSTLSHILSPFVKWLSPQDTSKNNEPSQKADATDSSSEEEAPPPMKKPCFSAPKSSNHSDQSEACCSTNSVSSVNLTNQKLKRDLNCVSTPNPIGTIDLTDDKEEQDCKNAHIESEQFFPTISRQSVIRKRKSFFDALQEKYDIPNSHVPANAIKDPNETNKESLLDSSYPRKSLHGKAFVQLMKEATVNNICKPIVCNSNSSDDEVHLSQSAKRVLRILENNPSHLPEFRRLSHIINSKKHNKFNTSMVSKKRNSYKTRELLVPRRASILSFEKKKNKEEESVMDTTNTAQQIIASHSSTTGVKPYVLHNLEERESSKSDHYSPKIPQTTIGDFSNINTPADLPPAVLEIDQNNLPNFNFGNSEVSETSNSIVASSEANSSTKLLHLIINGDTRQKIDKEKQNEPEEQTNKNRYKFSMPVIILKCTPNSSPSKTVFSNPQQDHEKTDVSEQQGCSIPIAKPLEIESNVVKDKLKQWKCSECWVNNNANASNCVCCSTQKPAEKNETPLKCTICKYEINQETVGNLCSKCESGQMINTNKQSLLPSSETLSWKCNDCWVKNDSLAEKCICCGSTKPDIKENENKTSEQKCADIQDNKNKSIHNKTIKLSTLSNDPMSSTFKTQDNAYVDILKAQTDMWECSCCLVNNNNNTSKCICCEAEKSNTDDTKIKQFNFNINGNTFKFGIDHNAKCDSNQNLEAEKMSINEEWETNNNIKTSSFNFGIPTQNTEDDKEKLITNYLNEAPSDIPKLKFNFGIPKQTTLDQLQSSNLLKCNGKQQEMTLISISSEKLKHASKPEMELSVVQDVLNPDKVQQDSTFKATLPSTLSNEEQFNPVPGDVDTQNMVTEDKNSSFNPLPTENNEVASANALSFCNSGLKIPTNLFNMPSVTEMSAVTSLNSLITSPLNNTDCLLEKSDVSSITETPLFQTTNTVTMFYVPEITKSIETTPTIKLFNFDHPNKSSMTLPEMPNFNYSYKNTKKTDAPQMFSTSFGETTNSNSLMNSYKFTFTTANMVGTNLSSPGNLLSNENKPTGNSIISNNLSGINGLSTGNPLGISESSMSVGKNIKLPSSLPTTVSMFDETLQKDNLWTNTKNTSTTLFVTGTNSNTLQRPPTFSFGIPAPLVVNNSSSIFGTNSSNVFSIQSQNCNLPTLFKYPNQNSTTSNFFGNQQSTNTSPSVENVFRNTSMVMGNSFGNHNPTISSFQEPLQNTMPTHSFNFGSSQQTSGGVFGFGRQPAQPSQNSVYTFGSNQQSTPQFTMGSSHNTHSVRRVRKAVRRSQR